MSRTIRADEITLDGETTVTGNLTVSGTTTTVETTNTVINDKVITLNNGETGSGVGGDGYSGLEFDRGTENNALLVFDESTDTFKVSTNAGGTYLTLLTSSGGGSGITAIVEDTTPQLGGDLDVNGNSIVSASNGNITIAPDGTGKLILDTYVTMENVVSAPSMTAGYATIYADTVSGGGSGVYVSNSTGQQELVTKSKAVVFGLIF